MSAVGNGYIKFMGYFFFPAISLILLLLPVFDNVEWGIECAQVGIVPIGLIFFSMARSISNNEKNRESDEVDFLSYMHGQGYGELHENMFKVRLTGRYSSDPTAVRTPNGNMVLVQDGSREGVSSRYYFYTVGEGDQYLLVLDSLDEKLRLFVR